MIALTLVLTFLVVLLGADVVTTDDGHLPISPALFAALVAIVIPPIVELVKTPSTPKPLGQLIAGATCLIVGAASAWINGDISFNDGGSLDANAVIVAFLAAYAAANIYYERFFKGTDLGRTIAAELRGAGFKQPPLPEFLAAAESPVCGALYMGSVTPALSGSHCTRPPHDDPTHSNQWGNWSG